MSIAQNEGRPAANGTASTRQDTGHELAPDSTVDGLASGIGALPPCPAWCDGDDGGGMHTEWGCRSEWPCDCPLGHACTLVLTHAVDLGHGVEVSVMEYRRGDRHAWGAPVVYAGRLYCEAPEFASVDGAERVLEHMQGSMRAFAAARELMARIEAETGVGRAVGGGEPS